MSDSRSGPALMRVLATLLGMGQTRLELAGVELAQARQSLLRVLVWGVLAVLLAVVGSVFAGAALVYALWPVHPVLALLVVGGVYAALAFLAYTRMTGQIELSPPLFEATVAELGRDKAALQEAAKALYEQASAPPSDRDAQARRAG